MGASKRLRVIIHEGDDEAAVMEKAVAEHIAAHPEDAGRTVKDFNWVVHEIVHPKFIIGADGSVRWPDETIEEGEFGSLEAMATRASTSCSRSAPTDVEEMGTMTQPGL